MPPLFHTGEQKYKFGFWKLNGFLIRAYFPWSGFQPFYKKFDNNFILDFFWSFWYSVSKWMALRLSKKLGKCKGSTRRNNVMSFLLSMFFAGSFWRIACNSICVHNHDNQRGDGYILCLHSKSQKLFYLKDKFIIQTVSNADIVYANFRNLQRIFPTRRSWCHLESLHFLGLFLRPLEDKKEHNCNLCI